MAKTTCQAVGKKAQLQNESGASVAKGDVLLILPFDSSIAIEGEDRGARFISFYDFTIGDFVTYGKKSFFRVNPQTGVNVAESSALSRDIARRNFNAFDNGSCRKAFKMSVKAVDAFTCETISGEKFTAKCIALSDAQTIDWDGSDTISVDGKVLKITELYNQWKKAADEFKKFVSGN
jgi:hypothetical protein